MKLSELIAAVGDDNVQFQNLDNDIVRLTTKNGHSEITFGTQMPAALSETVKLGLVIWLDREAVTKVTTAAYERLDTKPEAEKNAPEPQ